MIRNLTFIFAFFIISFAKSNATMFFDLSLGKSQTKTKLTLVNPNTLQERVLEDRDTNSSFDLGFGKKFENFNNSNFGLHIGLNFMFNGFGTYHSPKESYNIRSFRSTFLYLGSHYSLKKIDFYARAGLSINSVAFERTLGGFIVSMLTLLLVDIDSTTQYGTGLTLGMAYKVNAQNSIFLEGSYVYANGKPSKTFRDELANMKTSSARLQVGYRVFF